MHPIHGEQVLEQLLHSSEAAFRKLYDQYAPTIYKVALRHLKQVPLAEDVVQIVFLKVWEQRTTLANIKCFTSWIHTVARNTIISSLRKQGSQENYLKYLLVRNSQYTESPETVCMNHDAYVMIQKAVSKLTPQQRQAFQLLREEGLSYDDIAQRMGIASNTVRAHLYKAHQFLRSYLHKNGVDNLTISIALIFFV